MSLGADVMAWIEKLGPRSWRVRYPHEDGGYGSVSGFATRKAAARRLGHRLDNRIIETYSHVAPEVERRLIRRLERRWHKARAQTTPIQPSNPQSA
jgi:hypothetical protein